MTDPQDPRRQSTVPVAAELSVHAEAQPSEVIADQGPAPAESDMPPAPNMPRIDAAERPLSSAQVAQFTGADDSGDANRQLSEAESIDITQS